MFVSDRGNFIDVSPTIIKHWPHYGQRWKIDPFWSVRQEWIEKSELFSLGEVRITGMFVKKSNPSRALLAKHGPPIVQGPRITDHNFDILKDLKVKTKAGSKYYDETAAERFELLDDQINSIIDDIPILKNIKIKKFLGAGDNGIAYTLEDGAVFKIFEARSDYDIKWFKQVQERGGSTDIIVHGYGHLDHIKPGMKWVAMEKLTPITELIPAGKQLDLDVQEINNFLSKFLSEKTRKFYRDPEFADSPIVKQIKQFDDATDKAAWLQKHAPKSEAISADTQDKLIRDLYIFFRDNPEVLGDVHSGNIGWNGEVFKVFDISRGKRDDTLKESVIKKHLIRVRIT